jgi:hypothetical protein
MPCRRCWRFDRDSYLIHHLPRGAACARRAKLTLGCAGTLDDWAAPLAWHMAAGRRAACVSRPNSAPARFLFGGLCRGGASKRQRAVIPSKLAAPCHGLTSDDRTSTVMREGHLVPRWLRRCHHALRNWRDRGAASCLIWIAPKRSSV